MVGGGGDDDGDDAGTLEGTTTGRIIRSRRLVRGSRVEA